VEKANETILRNRNKWIRKNVSYTYLDPKENYIAGYRKAEEEYLKEIEELRKKVERSSNEDYSSTLSYL
jgi:hypothetical protein